MNESYMYSHSSFFIATAWQNKDFQISHTLKLAWVLIVRDSSVYNVIFIVGPDRSVTVNTEIFMKRKISVLRFSKWNV
jgi:hypothetical protein